MFKLFIYLFVFYSTTFQKTQEEKQFESYLRNAIKKYIKESKTVVDNSLFSFAEETRKKLKELENSNFSKKNKILKSKKIIDNQFEKLLIHVKTETRIFFNQNEKFLKENIEKLHPKENSDNWDSMKKDFEYIIHDYLSNLIKRTRLKFDIRTKFLKDLKDNVNVTCNELNSNYHDQCVSQILNYLRALSPMIFNSYKQNGLEIESHTKKQMLFRRENSKNEINNLQKSIIKTKELYKDLEVIKKLSYNKNVKNLLQGGLDVFIEDVKRYNTIIDNDNKKIIEIDNNLKENLKDEKEEEKTFRALLARKTIDN